MTEPSTRFLLVCDFRSKLSIEERMADLRRRLSALPGFGEAVATPHGGSSAFVDVPSRNRMHTDRLRSVLKDGLSGWSVVDGSSYRLP